MAQITVYMPDELWGDYQRMRDDAKDRGEAMFTTSSLFRQAVGSEMRRIARRAGISVPASVSKYAVIELRDGEDE